MSTKSKIAIVLFVLQIISTAGIVIGTSKDYLGALAYAVGLSVFMIIAAVLVLVDNKKMYDKIKNSKSDFFVDETIKQTEQEDKAEEHIENRKENKKSNSIDDIIEDKFTSSQKNILALVLIILLPTIFCLVIYAIASAFL